MTAHYDGVRLCWTNRRTRTKKVVFGEVLYEAGGVCGPRVQRDFELVILHSGQCRVTVDDIMTELQVGTVYLFLPGHYEHFRFSADKETHHSYCSIHPGVMPKGLSLRLQRAPRAVHGSDVLRLLLEAALKLRAPRDAATGLLIEQLGLCAFAAYLSSCQNATSNADPDPALHAFIQHLEDNFDREDCLQAAHRAAGISRNAMIGRFRAKMGTTPGRFLWRFRTEHGVAMLAETGLTVAEIAYACGFKCPFHFSRTVKRHLGQPPRSLRRQIWSAVTAP